MCIRDSDRPARGAEADWMRSQKGIIQTAQNFLTKWKTDSIIYKIYEGIDLFCYQSKIGIYLLDSEARFGGIR